MPIAIQYYTNRAEGNPVWTPKDSRPDWLLAKIVFNNANMQRQQLVDHLLYTHLISEVYTIAMKRNVSPNHPIYRLMHPHLLLVTAVNTDARDRLLSDGFINYLFSIGKLSLFVLQFGPELENSWLMT